MTETVSEADCLSLKDKMKGSGKLEGESFFFKGQF